MSRRILEHPIAQALLSEGVRIGSRIAAAGIAAGLREVGATAREIEKRTKKVRKKIEKFVEDIPSEYVHDETYQEHDDNDEE